MDVSSTLVRVGSLEVDCVAHDVVLVHDAVAAEHVTGLARNVEGLHAVVALNQRNLYARNKR